MPSLRSIVYMYACVCEKDKVCRLMVERELIVVRTCHRCRRRHRGTHLGQLLMGRNLVSCLLGVVDWGQEGHSLGMSVRQDGMAEPGVLLGGDVRASGGHVSGEGPV